MVGELAAKFAHSSWAELARTAGRWHDIGKYQATFQRYIGAEAELSNEDNPGIRSVPHSAAGAALALDRFAPTDVRLILLALVIEAHHGALKACRSIADVAGQRGEPLLRAARVDGLPQEREHENPSFLATPSALGVRMLFSALVDADLLNTEEWDRGFGRVSAYDSLETLRDRLCAACEAKRANAKIYSQTVRRQALNRMRQEVYVACVASATKPRGAFTLTVPTGGGKTLSGLAFALHHAVHHGMTRVIVVAPYTSILEQTAKVYRDVLGEENIVEHHSNLAAAQDTDRNRQASENWDAPVIVTTSVQLLESLHAAHKRHCRKLHRIANSVVLLDEVQTFPTDLLQPIHAVLKRLVENFGVTVVHGTATQPLLAGTKNVLRRHLQMPMDDIVQDPVKHFHVVRDRSRLERLGDLRTPLPIEELAQHIGQYQTALAITHRRRDAAQLAELLGPQCLHLSAAMCAEHRSAVLDEVRRRLAGDQPCLLVSTQLIEAGVDIDFPVVFRALAGLETLAQAAGRCNRELRLPEPGRFIVYRAGVREPNGSVVESTPPPGSPCLGLQVALTYFEDTDPDLSNPDLFPAYTRRVLSLLETDKRGLITLEDAWDFPEVAERFRMVEEATISVVAPYGGAQEMVAALRRDGPSRDAFRALQRFTVGLREPQFNALHAAGWIEPVLSRRTDIDQKDTLWTVREGMGTIYHPRFGFHAGRDALALEPLIA